MLSICEFLNDKYDLSDIKKKKLKDFASNHQIKAIINFIKKEKILKENDLLKGISLYYQIPLYRNKKVKLSNNNLLNFSLEDAKKYNLIVLKKSKKRIIIGSLYPPDLFLKEKLKYKFKLKPEFYLMSENEFQEAEKKIYNNYFKVDQSEILKDLTEIDDFDSKDLDSLKNIVEDAPVVKLLNKILVEAVNLEASDIHLEKKKNNFKVRYRIDGILKTYYNFPPLIAAAVISRIKIISGMDITNRKLPQDGKLEFDFQDLKYDIRTSVVPTIYGEKAVLRLLLRNENLLAVDELNFLNYNFKKFKKILNIRSGIILLSGPTGSGKTTTLFSILNEIANDENNVITVENPVEYKLELLNQIEINEAQGLTFPLILRSILRQDPDVIMIGEIRDKETAEIAIRAAVTGHLVLSTIHTIDSISAVYRLLEMGIAPYLISSTLKAVVSQRLLRKLCFNCRQKIPLKNKKINLESSYVYQAVGCDNCRSGYKGRTAAVEILLINEKLQELINNNSPRSQIKKAAVENGLMTIDKSALKKIENGLTTVDEFLRIVELKN